MRLAICFYEEINQFLAENKQMLIKHGLRLPPPLKGVSELNKQPLTTFGLQVEKEGDIRTFSNRSATWNEKNSSYDKKPETEGEENLGNTGPSQREHLLYGKENRPDAESDFVLKRIPSGNHQNALEKDEAVSSSVKHLWISTTTPSTSYESGWFTSPHTLYAVSRISYI